MTELDNMTKSTERRKFAIDTHFLILFICQDFIEIIIFGRVTKLWVMLDLQCNE